MSSHCRCDYYLLNFVALGKFVGIKFNTASKFNIASLLTHLQTVIEATLSPV